MVVRLSPSFREGSDVREQEAPNTTAISIHAPAKGATVAGSPQTLISSFQSTLPRRERQGHQDATGGRDFYFNPRSREGSDRPSSARPTRPRHFNPRSREGSDLRHDVCSAAPHPFQSTLPRRERLRVLTGLRQARRYFNPRSREGSDDQRKYSLLEYSAISIHAPAKGATSARWFPWSSPSHFNPRSREGSDTAALPRAPATSHFNPRSREGSDAARLNK